MGTPANWECKKPQCMCEKDGMDGCSFYLGNHFFKNPTFCPISGKPCEWKERGA